MEKTITLTEADAVRAELLAAEAELAEEKTALGRAEIRQRLHELRLRNRKLSRWSR